MSEKPLTIKSPNCAYCKLKPCSREPHAVKPNFCPMIVYPETVAESIKKYVNTLKELHRIASIVEKEGYCLWPRLREVAEFSKKLNIRKLGVAFCIGLSNEAEFVVKYLESKGFEVYSVCCKCGGFDKTLIGLTEEQKLRPNTHESICNPIIQAELLNKVATELNVVVGLCVGHDTLFIMHSKAPVTYLIAKDRVTGHNPAAAIYAQNYFKSRLDIT
ncbi:MAG: DUF1847 domain-containing protein [Sulfolobales archaeon]